MSSFDVRWSRLKRNFRVTISRWYKQMTVSNPDKKFYKPEFSPWLCSGYGELAGYFFKAKDSLLCHEKVYFLHSFLKQTIPVLGDVVECGVYRGGAASVLVSILEDNKTYKKLHLFDTFHGIPNSNPELDSHHAGDFDDTSLEVVKATVSHEDRVVYHVGEIPDTFKGCESMVVSFVHIDVDVHKAYVDCLNFFWPRLSPGGVLVLDDYGHPNTTGARKAADDFFADKREKPIVLLRGQAVVIKNH